MDNIKFNPNRALSHNVSRILVFVLFLTSFILLWPFSLSLELDVPPLRLRYKDRQSARQ